jgi:hypothetical protein
MKGATRAGTLHDDSNAAFPADENGGDRIVVGGRAPLLLS